MTAPSALSATDRRRPARRGAVLVQFALLVAALLGIAALVGDLGLARDARSAMQRATESAALEGLRWTDHASDAVRRERAAQMVRGSFDADGRTATPADYQLVDDRIGAGPVVSMASASGVYGAGGLDPASIGVHKPDPALNLANASHGDLVAGEMRPEVLGVGSAAFEVAHENASYQRNDFDAAAAASATGARAFLARLRRTPDLQGLDAVPGVSTTGGGVPLLFGQGPLTLASKAGGYDVRREGLAVRATAIAQARRAVAAGPFLRALATQVPGAWERSAFGYAAIDATIAGTALELALVPAIVTADPRALVAGASGTFDLAVDGTVTESGPPAGFAVELLVTPRARALAIGDVDPPRDGLLRVGDELLAFAIEALGSTTLSLDSPADPDDAGSPLIRHALAVPVVDAVTRRVVGFVGADVYLGPSGEEGALRAQLASEPETIDEVLGRTPNFLRLAVLAPRVLPINALADDDLAWSRLRADLALAGLHGALDVALLAPTLVR